MDKHLNDSYKLRLPPELKARIAESAKAHNRSMNADIVARLEKSFDDQPTDKEEIRKIVKEENKDIHLAIMKLLSVQGLTYRPEKETKE